MTSPPIPTIAVLAHGYLAAYDNQGDELWVNTELLNNANRLAACLSNFFTCLAGVYRIQPDIGHALTMPKAGPLHYAFQAVARILAYNPTKTSPPEIAELLVSSIMQDHDGLCQHIGRHPLRLHAYTIYTIEQSPVTCDSNTDETRSAMKLFAKEEFRGIAAAFAIATQTGVEPELVNKEELVSKRARIGLTI